MSVQQSTQYSVQTATIPSSATQSLFHLKVQENTLRDKFQADGYKWLGLLLLSHFIAIMALI